MSKLKTTRTQFIKAARHNAFQCVKLLLENNAYVNVKKCCSYSIEREMKMYMYITFPTKKCGKNFCLFQLC